MTNKWLRISIGQTGAERARETEVRLSEIARETEVRLSERAREIEVRLSEREIEVRLPAQIEVKRHQRREKRVMRGYWEKKGQKRRLVRN